jgi:hypothetical protein
MNQSQDDAIEGLLRAQFDGPLRDEGFSGQVMHRLPQRRHGRITWPLWIGVVAGAATCWLALLPSRLLREGWQDWTGGHWSVTGLAMLSALVVMILLAFAWSVAEAGDR